ncbi:MAG: ribonuclease Y [Anaerolineales bacterium]|nr:ribonuclease Y [Chloroflexota bacterium]MBL6983371.1 ribonuclease Y [Anaerolineales bacterium]
MNSPPVLWIPIVAAILGAAIGFFLKAYQVRQANLKLKDQGDRIIVDAKEEAREIKLQAKDEMLKVREEADAEISRRREEVSRSEDRLQRRQDQMDARAERLERREQSLNKRQSVIDRKSNDIEKIEVETREKLEQVARMSAEEARQFLLDDVEKESRDDMARIIRQVEAEAQEEGERRARKMVADAIQRVASEHVVEVTSSSVPLPSDDMKGRIIGRNGRNIHAFERAAGVDVIVDDTPEAITISSFDPVRREVARRSMERLVLDGRIHPAHIEKIVKKEASEVDRVIREAGEEAAYEAGVPGLHKEITKILGRLKFRTSYGQNQLAHAVETSKLAAVLAAELGADVEVSKAGALLHDLGKAMDHNVEGTHAQIGADFAKRYGVNERILNTIASHHHEVEQESVEAVIVESADAISGARPGARRESLEMYLKRVRALEEIANTYEGVKETYALQAGREVRIFVKPEDIDDLASINLASDISKQIEETMQYPGQIKVTVIRETRATEYAK